MPKKYQLQKKQKKTETATRTPRQTSAKLKKTPTATAKKNRKTTTTTTVRPKVSRATATKRIQTTKSTINKIRKVRVISGRAKVTRRKKAVVFETNIELSEKQRQKIHLLKLLTVSLQKLKDKYYSDGISKSCKEKLDYIRTHKRNNDVKLIGRSFRVGQKGSTKVFTGIKPKLGDKFWPDTDENPFTRNPEDLKRRRPLVQMHPKGMKKQCKLSGEKHGKLVHAQVCRFTKSFSKRNVKMKLPMTTLDPCTIRILNLFITKGWVPVMSELPIYNEDWRTATSIDLIVVELTTSKIIVIEIKTGYEEEEYGEHPTDKVMRTPMNHVINCPKNRHVMQLLGMLIMLKNRYGVSVDDAFVLRSCAKMRGAVLVNMPSWSLKPATHTAFNKALTAGAYR